MRRCDHPRSTLYRAYLEVLPARLEALPPLLAPKKGLPSVAGEGWGGVALRDRDQELHSLPASPCKQGEQQSRPLLASKYTLLASRRSLPCLQGRVGVGLLFAKKIKSFTPPNLCLRAGRGAEPEAQSR
ncbi:hypothetical protein HDE77_002432 [Rhodanobacter sp. MP7CTX1]|nr:hypothetical protein [Rhodanobacter sp. MP7CTX1]